MGLLVGIALWLGVDASRESKRLHARLSQVPADRPLLVDGDLYASSRDWDYWPAGDAAVGPRT